MPLPLPGGTDYERIQERGACAKVLACHVGTSFLRQSENRMCYLQEFNKFVLDKGHTEYDMVPLFFNKGVKRT